MFSVNLIRKIASVLLLLCFVLPLSKCESKQEAGKQSSAAQVKKEATDPYVDGYLYPYKLTEQAWHYLHADDKAQAAWNLVLLFLVFFLPACLLATKEKLQIIFTSMATLPVGLAIFSWVYFWGSPQAGGIAITILWSVLVLLNLRAIYLGLRRWWKNKKAALAQDFE